MPPQQTGKERAARIPLDYYKKPNPLERWKTRLGLLALLGTCAGLGADLVLSSAHDHHASRGPLTAVHQSWDNQCSACHVAFTPVSSHSWAAPFLGDPLESSQRCRDCHAGPVHHAGQTPEQTCGSCHRDHRGRDASLVNLADSDCTQCHNDLSRHTSAKSVFQNDVSRFGENTHPKFRSIAHDPGTLKFNHRRHLAAGMALEVDGQRGGAIQTLGKIPEPFRTRYRDQQQNKSDHAPVQLQCASCHVRDSGDSGAYMVPITYENQCQACHPLSLERKVADDPKHGLLSVPHRWQPGQIHELLENFFTAQLARGQAGFLEKKVLPPLPGKIPSLLEPSVRAEIAKKVAFAEKDLYLSQRLCAECHAFQGKSIPEAVMLGQAPDLRIAPVNVPRVWFQHAKFNHTSHRAVECADCHAGAATSMTHADVLIPDRDNCVKCHAPITTVGSPGVRFNCTECHRYHRGDHTTARDPMPRSFDVFLRGR